MPVVDLTFDASGALIGARDYDTAAKKVGDSTDDIKRKTGGVDTAFVQLGKSSKKTWKGIGTAVVAAQAIIGGALVGIAMSTINAASDMQETQGKFDTVFRGMESSAESWATTLNDSYLLTKQQSKQYLSSIQDLLVPTGMAREEAGEMSNSFVKLAADLASFNNLETADVVRDIQSALAGGSETMTKYGIDVKVAAVQQEAITLGLIKTKDEMTNSIRAQALLSLAYKDSGDALGDVARTQDSYANQLRLSQKLIGDLTVTIGEKFLPVATRLLTAFNEWASKAENLNGIINTVIETARAFYNAFKGIEIVLKSVIVAFAYLLETIATGISKLIEPFTWVLETLGIIEKDTIPGVIRGFEDFTASAVDGLSRAIDGAVNMNNEFDNLRETTVATNNESTKTLSTVNSVNNAISAGSVVAADSSVKTAQSAANAAQAAAYARQAAASANLGSGLSGVTDDGNGGYSWESPDGSTSSAGYGTAPGASSENGGYVDPNSGGSSPGSGLGFISESKGVNITNNFNQNISKSDVAGIVSEQQRMGSRI